jgi:tRNA/rRNA methyltransferase
VVGTTSVGHRELIHPLRRLEAGARLMRKQAGPVALLFGSEKFGLSNEDMSHCHWLMRIVTADFDHSMNLGQAVAVCLYELARDGRAAAAARAEKIKLATAADHEQITALLVEALECSGYIKALTAGSTKAKVRRLVRRLNVGTRDVPVILGMLRQILWKVESGH